MISLEQQDLAPNKHHGKAKQYLRKDTTTELDFDPPLILRADTVKQSAPLNKAKLNVDSSSTIKSGASLNVPVVVPPV